MGNNIESYVFKESCKIFLARYSENTHFREFCSKFSFKLVKYSKGPLTLSMKISPCTEKGTSTRLFVTICDEIHIMFSFNPILDIPQRS